ncbi:Uu.00g100670.m01.CDS01 [Anthostomella pinea]|uniref:Uu.00g100670.m01.CDS01 n=1 Tax=Anthostomella pinea TaxID=933095 RepID=A0AAI8VDK1_9PEZI|nr:Uu.00g100670.m01.CDS01 [Anthostomella pinea]
MAMYKYPPLPGKGYIRTLTLHPGQFDDELVISLADMAFSDSHHDYEALSYVWGSEGTPEPVGVGTSDGPVLLATQNLAVALRHLRHAERPRFLWIDALCINQKNDEEKGPQVAMMGDIYRRAARVIAWLGPAKDDSDHAMERFEYLGLQVDVDWTTAAAIKPIDGCVDSSLGELSTELPFDSRGMTAIYHLQS